jgi:hypothetical protein
MPFVMKKIFKVAALFLIAFLCCLSAWVNLTLIRPALLNLPQDIQYLKVVERTHASDNKKYKHRGRLALNIAVGYEVLGNIDEAFEWASKAYTDYKEKMIRDYVSDLKARI